MSNEEKVKSNTKSRRLLKSVTSQYYKTRLCPNMNAEGTCERLKKCYYAHSEVEIRRPPDLNKTKMCVKWQHNECTDDNCKYAHGSEELRHTDSYYKVRICHFWKYNGICKRGDNCRHAHGDEELRRITIPPVKDENTNSFNTERKFSDLLKNISFDALWSLDKSPPLSPILYINNAMFEEEAIFNDISESFCDYIPVSHSTGMLNMLLHQQDQEDTYYPFY